MGAYQQEPAAAGVVGAGPGRWGVVAAVSCNDVYSFTKPNRDEITLIAGLGVEGDVHAGVTVKHRSRVAADPTQPNLRQVHLIHAELHDEVRPEGYEVPAGGLGENLTTVGLDLLGLPVGTILRFGPPPAGEATSATTGEPSDGSAGQVGPWEGATGGVGLSVAAIGGAGSPVGAGDDGGAPVGGGGSRRAPVGGGEPAAGPVGVDGGGSPVGAAGDGGARVGGVGSPVGVEGRGGFSEGAAGWVGPPEGAAAVITAAAAARIEAHIAPVVAVLAARIEGEGSAVGGGVPRPAVIITGLRNPCQQINGYRSGLLKHVLGRDAGGSLVRKAGVMAVVLHGGAVRPGDRISVELPGSPHRALDRV
ncbi:MOSC domain-containing protein [Actinoplanes sp. NPDC049668]|uniref:MOSC domain-containing protein n=1 Tax=unclassified Actinoplanes TaxID=2626549 RepID=UPI0033AE3315